MARRGGPYSSYRIERGRASGEEFSDKTINIQRTWRRSRDLFSKMGEESSLAITRMRKLCVMELEVAGEKAEALLLESSKERL